jgi:formiminoglutamase
LEPRRTESFFEVVYPDFESPVVVNFAHSGTRVPEDVVFKQGAVLSNTDWFLPELFSFLKCTQVVNFLSRYVVDMNRALSLGAGRDYRESVVYEQNTQGSSLYEAPLTKDEEESRIRRYYEPYHKALEGILEKKIDRYGHAVLIDLHSFFVNFAHGGDENIYLSISESPLSQAFAASFRSLGYSVCQNACSGGYIAGHYKRFFEGCLESLMIELRYPVYLGDRFYGEEVVKSYDLETFKHAGRDMKTIFEAILEKESQWVK